MSVKRKVLDSVENGDIRKKKLKGSKVKVDSDPIIPSVPNGDKSETHNIKDKKSKKEKKSRIKDEEHSPKENKKQKFQGYTLAFI